MLLGVPACMTNSMIKYMEIKIACLFRERLTSEAVKRYMSSNTFYSVANLDGRLGNADQVRLPTLTTTPALTADQCLTNDIEKFSQHLSHLCVCSCRCLLLSPPPSRPARAAGTLKSASPSSTLCL
jgi:ABC-type uncharacterized transport system fused permease/ATPase subunit